MTSVAVLIADKSLLSTCRELYPTNDVGTNQWTK